MIRQRELEHREVRHAARSRTHVDDVIGARAHVGGQRVRTGEARHHQTHPTRRAFDEQRRQQRRKLGRPGDVPLLLDRDGEVSLVRRRAHRVGARRLALPFQILQKRREPLERLELVGIDGQKMSGAVLEAIVAGEQHQRGRVRRLDDDVGDHHLELFDASAIRHGQAAHEERKGREGTSFFMITRGARCARCVHRATCAHYWSAKAYNVSPAPTTINWRPSTMKVCGPLLVVAPRPACHSGLPLLAS